MRQKVTPVFGVVHATSQLEVYFVYEIPRTVPGCVQMIRSVSLRSLASYEARRYGTHREGNRELRDLRLSGFCEANDTRA